MSEVIDEKVVQMRFENSDFEKNTKESMNTLEKLKNCLNFSKSKEQLNELSETTKRFDLNPMYNAVEGVSNKFNILETVATGVIYSLTNMATQAGLKIARSLSLESAISGMQEYETQINAVQTILANTSKEGTTLQQVNDALDELNVYADKTIYNFTEMTRNIGTFTAAGVNLKTSVSSIKGIANLAAVSGSTSQQASVAMYQLSQALATGTVKLQDWNSVVNAGMGGKVFQDALKRTAENAGKNVDALIEKYGSFRESLSKGEWLTTEVLTETLNQFAGVYDKAQLKEMGYSQQQIKDIMDMAKVAEDAATKVKTFTQLLDTVKEEAQSGWAKTWQIIVGDFEEAKKFWTEISDTINPIISASSEKRNNILEGWSELGGREKVIDTLRASFEALKSIVEPIQEAFREVFPSSINSTVISLYKVTDSIKSFVVSLKLTEPESEKLKNSFKAIFTVIDIIRKTIKAVGTAISNSVGSFRDFRVAIFSINPGISEFIIGLNKYMDSTKVYTKITDTLTNGLTKLSVAIEKVVKKIGEKFKMPSFESFLSFLDGIYNVLTFIGSKISKVASKIGTSFSDVFSFGDVTQGFEMMSSGMLTAVTYYLSKFVGNFSGLIEDMSDIINDAKSPLGELRECLESYQDKLKAETLMSIAKAVAVLAASLFVIASIKPDKLTSAFEALTLLFGELVGMTALLTRLDTNSLRETASTVGMLNGLAVSMLLLSTSLKIIGGMSVGDLIKGVSAITIFMYSMVQFIKYTSGLKGASMASATLISMALSVNVLALAISKFGNMKPEELAKGLIGVAASIAILVVALRNMPDKAAIGSSISLIAAATALNILASAVERFGNTKPNVLKTGLSAMAVAIGELVVALNLMKTTLPGSAALIIASSAIALLTPPIIALGKLKVGEIIKSLITLASTLAILGAAAVLMTPIIPELLAVSAAIALFGVGLAGVGIGVSVVVTALTFLSTMTAAAATGIVASLTILTQGLVSLVPLLAITAAKGIVTFVKTILDSGGVIINSVVNLLTVILDNLKVFVPKLITFVIDTIKNLLETLASNTKGIIEAAANIMINFMKGLTEKLPELVETGFELTLAFINSIADSLRNNKEKVAEAIENFVLSIIETAVEIIDKSPSLFKKAISALMESGVLTTLANFIKKPAEKVASMISTMINTIKNSVEKFKETGRNLILGFIEGISSMIGKVASSVKNIGDTSISTLKNVLGIHSPSREFFEVGEYAGSGLINGLNSYAGKVADASDRIGSVAISGINNAMKKVGDFISSGMDSNPVITPVLDLSNVRNSASQLSSILKTDSMIGLSTNIGAISAMMSANQNASTNDDVISAINRLGLSMNKPSNNYTINGITYDDGSNVSSAVESLIRATRIERRM